MIWADAPADQRAIYDAYVAATEMKVSCDPARKDDVMELVRRGITAADVTTVIGYIRRKMREQRGEGGFDERSLLWRNAMNPSTMEERALLCRQAAARRASAKPRPPVAETDAAGVTRLGPAGAAEPKPAGALLAGVLRKISDDAEGGR